MIAGLNGTQTTLLGVAVAAALIFLCIRHRDRVPGRAYLKGSVCLLLAAMALGGDLGRDGWLLAAALGFGALGDVFLDHPGESNFVRGLAAFLVGQLIYALLFGLHVGDTSNWPLALVVIAFAGTTAAWLWPDLGRYRVPVAAYMAAITAMGLTAALADFAGPWVFFGAALFIISDTLIAIDKFKHRFAGAHHLIWLTYVAGQTLITLGVMAQPV